MHPRSSGVFELQSFLDITVRRFHGSEISCGMDDLCKYLLDLCIGIPPQLWKEGIKPACLQHEIRNVLHQDPHTLRAFEKP